MLLDRGLSLFAFVDDGNTTSLKLLRFYLSGYLYVLVGNRRRGYVKDVKWEYAVHCDAEVRLIKGATESYECTPLGSW